MNKKDKEEIEVIRRKSNNVGEQGQGQATLDSQPTVVSKNEDKIKDGETKKVETQPTIKDEKNDDEPSSFQRYGVIGLAIAVAAGFLIYKNINKS